MEQARLLRLVRAKRVEQSTLKEIVDAELEIEGLEGRLKEKRKELMGLQELVRIHLDKGTPIEKGAFGARVDVTQRRNISWKDVFAARNGVESVERVIEGTEPTAYPKVVVFKNEA